MEQTVTHDWIGVDLDRTLAYYDNTISIKNIGHIIPKMKERVLGWLNQGIKVKIFTARVDETFTDTTFQRVLITKWLKDNGLPALEITNVKDASMIALYDDRAFHVIPNTGEVVEPK